MRKKTQWKTDKKKYIIIYWFILGKNQVKEREN